VAALLPPLQIRDPLVEAARELARLRAVVREKRADFLPQAPLLGIEPELHGVTAS
jgi:hypothetical protein